MSYHINDFSNHKLRLAVINQVRWEACLAQLLIENGHLLICQKDLSALCNFKKVRLLKNIPSYSLVIVFTVNTRYPSLALSRQFSSLIVRSNNHQHVTDIFFIIGKNHFTLPFSLILAKNSLIWPLVLRSRLTRRPISCPFSSTTKLGTPYTSHSLARSR